MATGKLNCVVVAVDGSEESMNALRWALKNLRSSSDGSEPGSFVVLHVQPPPSISAGLNPGAIPFGGPSHVEVPAFTAAIEAHQRRITEAIIGHALEICKEKNADVKTQVVVGDPKETICEVVAKLKADLLVMGCRAYGPIKRKIVYWYGHMFRKEITDPRECSLEDGMFLGSVSNHCINHVSCPVVVIKGISTS